MSQDATWRMNDMNRHAIRGVIYNHRDVVRGMSDAANQQFMRELNEVASHDVNRIDDTQTTKRTHGSPAAEFGKYNNNLETYRQHQILATSMKCINQRQRLQED